MDVQQDEDGRPRAEIFSAERENELRNRFQIQTRIHPRFEFNQTKRVSPILFQILDR